MTIISRYIRLEMLKYFGMVLMMVVVIYLVVDFIEKIDNFMEAGVGLGSALQFFVFKIPSILTQVIPIATLLAVLIALGLMARNNELIALRAGGVGLIALTRPVAHFGLLALLMVIALSEIIAPLTNVGANRIWLERVKHRRAAATPQNDIWVQLQHAILHLKYYQPETRTAMGVTLHRFDELFSLVERVQADSAVFENNRWQLRQVMRQLLNPSSRQFDVELFDTLDVPLGIGPEDLAHAVPRAEEMSFMQLYHYIAKVRSEGYHTLPYLVDWHAKIAFPFACIIMALVGAGLTLSGKLKEGLPLNIACGIGIAFVYWIAFSFCVSLGYAGLLPPIVAVWIVNWIWLCLAGLLLLNADR